MDGWSEGARAQGSEEMIERGASERARREGGREAYPPGPCICERAGPIQARPSRNPLPLPAHHFRSSGSGDDVAGRRVGGSFRVGGKGLWDGPDGGRWHRPRWRVEGGGTNVLRPPAGDQLRAVRSVPSNKHNASPLPGSRAAPPQVGWCRPPPPWLMYDEHPQTPPHPTQGRRAPARPRAMRAASRAPERTVGRGRFARPGPPRLGPALFSARAAACGPGARWMPVRARGPRSLSVRAKASRKASRPPREPSRCPRSEGAAPSAAPGLLLEGMRSLRCALDAAWRLGVVAAGRIGSPVRACDAYAKQQRMGNVCVCVPRARVCVLACWQACSSEGRQASFIEPLIAEQRKPVSCMGNDGSRTHTVRVKI